MSKRIVRSMNLDFAKLPQYIGIVGSRKFPEPARIEAFLDRLPPTTIVVSGGAKEGADKIAEDYATVFYRHNPVIKLPDFKTYGSPKALFERNTQIVQEVAKNNGVVFAFLVFPEQTGGTRDTLAKCKLHNVPYVAFRMKLEGGAWAGLEVEGDWSKYLV